MEVHYGTKEHSTGAKMGQVPKLYSSIWIQDVSVRLECYSLTYYLRFIKHLSGENRHIPLQGHRRRWPNRRGNQPLLGEVKQDLHHKFRFIPLIIDEEHAARALPLLQEELVRLDRLNNKNYELSVSLKELDRMSGGSTPTVAINRLNNLFQLPEFDPEIGFRVISAIMNATVVSFSMKAQSNVKLQEKAFVGT